MFSQPSTRWRRQLGNEQRRFTDPRSDGPAEPLRDLHGTFELWQTSFNAGREEKVAARAHTHESSACLSIISAKNHLKLFL